MGGNQVCAQAAVSVAGEFGQTEGHSDVRKSQRQSHVLQGRFIRRCQHSATEASPRREPWRKPWRMIKLFILTITIIPV